MRRVFSTYYNAGLANTWLLIFRVAIGAFMLTHGYPKFQRLVSGEAIQFADPFGIGAYPSFVLTVFAEVVCSVLIILGLGTRIAAFVLVINMLVAAFIAHAADPFKTKEVALMYLLAYITLVVFGAGKYSLDYVISGKPRGVRR